MLAFISHSQEDNGIYSALRIALDAAKLNRWDPLTMSSGKPLAEQLRYAIRQCYACVFVVTRRSVASHWCLAEVGAFWGAGKRIVLFMGESGLSDADLPPQFVGSLWINDVDRLVKELVAEAQTAAPRVMDHPANLFWLGHDLARAIRHAMFEPHNRDELDKDLRQALHHFDQIGVPAPEARRLLLSAIKTYRGSTGLSEDSRKEFVSAIAKAKNEVGSMIENLQPEFRPYLSIEDTNRLDEEIRGLAH